MPEIIKKSHKPYRLVVGVSGSGTTFEAIAKKVKSGKLKLEIPFIFADRNCVALEKAAKMHIKIVQKNSEEHIDEFHARVIAEAIKHGVDFIALCGYLRLFPVKMHDPYLVLNSHPGAIPEFGGAGFYGKRVHETVLDFAKNTDFRHPYTYSTIHIASAEYDQGPVVGLKRLNFTAKDSAEEIAAKLLPIEHQNYLEVLERFSKDLIEYFDNPKDLVLKKEKKILEKSRSKVLKK